VIIKVLKAQGALVFARTNIPQTMLSYECSNPVFGQTRNPYCLERGPGGSSGGEGSLIGSRASILGIGGDVGGSLRIPAAFSGCCGFKPTVRRA
jgi:fatty acid amide hydrolase